MLSEENEKKIIKTGLYRAEPNKCLQGWYGDDPYWCKNWTFVVVSDGGELFMVDTYFKDKYILLTNDNINMFSLVFDFNDVCVEKYPEEYDECDIYYRIRVDSGGMTSPQTFKKTSAKRSRERMIKTVEYKILDLERQLLNAKEDLKMYKNGTHWLLQ